MVRSNPIVDFDTLSKLYTKSKFTYEGEIENLTKSYMRAIGPVLQKLKKNDLIVEVGCGNGFVLDAVLQKGYKNAYGVEPSTHAIANAPARLRKRIKESVFKKSLFRTNSVAFLFIFQTLDHIPEPEKFLKAAYETIRPGGYMLSLHHNVESMSAQVLGERSPIFDVEHTQLFSIDTSSRLFEKAGFLVQSVYSPVSTLSLKHLSWLFPFPKKIKEKLLLGDSFLAEFLAARTVDIHLGNVCIIARKPL
jgi:SAM-dependent methyltransferase